MSFRAWALFMTIVHTMYFIMTCDHFREITGLTMTDIFFIHGIEILATFITILRLYFIIEAHGIDMTDKNNDINPIKKFTDSIQKAITSPESPKDINGNKKKLAKKANNLQEKLINLLF